MPAIPASAPPGAPADARLSSGIQVTAEELLQAANALALEIAANPPQVTRMTKKLLREGMHQSLASILELSAAYQALAHQTADHREAVSAFLEKRKPEFKG